MAESIRDLMTPDPHCVDVDASIQEAAEVMRDKDIGPVIVTENGDVAGILTDRDIVIRAVAEGRDPGEAKVGDVCTRNVTTVSADQSVDDAIQVMRDADVRRVPVVDGDEPVGIVSLGDLAQEREPESVLADISAAPPDS
jgi:CBS domain-containing protein